MNNRFILLVMLCCSMQIPATNLVLQKWDGVQQLQDIATIGKWIFVEDDLQLLGHDGTILAQEPIKNIRKITLINSEDLSATENITTPNIVIYPNPAQEILLVKGVESQMLRVFDLQGRLLKTENGVQVTVSDLASGTYLLQVGTQVVRFIKQ